ncbi:MAG TPA: hypothetical protein VGJ66_06740 [Pyrinomonadaceae bacterium]
MQTRSDVAPPPRAILPGIIDLKYLIFIGQKGVLGSCQEGSPSNKTSS